jgi:hypothetical protein
MSQPLLLLDTVPRVTAELARNLLEEAGIPVVLTGPDFDVAELGAFAHDTLRGVSVLVARESFDAACELLDAAWGEEWRKKEGGPLAAAGARASDAPEPPPTLPPGWPYHDHPFGRMFFVLGLEILLGCLG